MDSKLVRYGPASSCIYCGSTENLTDEHVLPFGIAGNAVIFTKASCKSCAKATSSIEASVLSQTLGLFREKYGVPTRHPKRRTGRAQRWVVSRSDTGKITPLNRKVEGDVRDLPAAYLALHLPPAKLLAAENANSEAKIWMWHNTTAEELTLLQKNQALHLGKFRPSDMYRFLAKIAHGIAVGELGTEVFSPSLTGIILGTDEDYPRCIGGLIELEPPDPEQLHVWNVGWARTPDGRGYAIVRLRMYALLGAPTYLIIAGVAR